MSGPAGSILSDMPITGFAAGMLLVLFSVILYRKTWPPVSMPRRILLGSMRGGGFILLAIFTVNPVLVSVRPEYRRPVLPVLLDVSRSMSITDRGGKTRIEAAAQAARSIKQMFREADVRIIPFSAEVFADAAENDTFRAAGEGTDIVGSIMSVLGRFQSDNLSSAIVISDGRVTRGMTSSPVAFSIPLFMVAAGERAENPDIRMDDVAYDRTAYTGARMNIETVVSVDGTAAGDLKVELLEEGRVVDSGTIDGRGGSGIYTALLHYTPGVEGEHRLTARVSGASGEKMTENNSAILRITVLKDRINILMIDQYPDWDMTFIRRMVGLTERYNIDVVTWRPEAGYRLGNGDENWEMRDIDSGYDLVVIGDDRTLLRAPSNADILESFVNKGGGVIFLACENSPLLDDVSYGNLERMLPLRRGTRHAVEIGEYFVHTAEGSAGNQIAALVGGAGALDRLPPLLAVFSGMATTAAAEVPLVLDDGKSGKPLLAVARHGDGVTAVVLGFPMWRWKLAGEDGEAAYHAFMSGLIGYVSEGMDSPAIRVDTGRPVYRTGEKVEITAVVRSDFDVKGVRGGIHVSSNGTNDLLASFLFTPEAGDKRVFRAVVDPLPGGEYLVTASGETNSGDNLTGDARIVIEPLSAEFVRTSRDQELLRKLALASGGSVIEINDIARLSSSISLQKDMVERKKVRSVRASLVFFVLIAGLFSAEWVLRKAWGMI